jgi:hypothetical protein
MNESPIPKIGELTKYISQKKQNLYEIMHECGLSIIKSATKGIERTS